MQRKIEEICLRVAENLKRTDSIWEIVSQRENRFVDEQVIAWEPMSLDYGYPGLIVFFSEMDAYFPGAGWNEQIYKLVSLLIPLIKEKNHSNFSLFSGLTGACFAIQIAAKQDSIFNKLDHQLCLLLAEEVGKYYCTSLDEFAELGHQPIPFQYDAITGIGAFLAYFLNYKHIPQVEHLIRRLLKYLVNLSKPIQVEGSLVPGWYLSPYDLFYQKSLPNFVSETLFQQYPKGFFELGMAHGIAGCLASLSKCLLAGIEIEGQREGVKRIASWLLGTCQSVDQTRLVWPKKLGFSSKNPYSIAVEKLEIIDAWSHGSPGIFHSLILAAKALKEKNIGRRCILGLQEVAKRAKQSSNNLPFCYGISGTLTILQCAALSEEKACFREGIEGIVKQILENYSVNFPFGFKCVAPANREEDFRMIDNPGLATGSIGILLSLLLFNSKKIRPWFPIFQLN